MKTIFYLFFFAAFVSACGVHEGPHVAQAINQEVQRTVDSLARDVFRREELHQCFAIVLENDGHCCAMVCLDTASINKVPTIPDTIASTEQIYGGNLFQPISLMEMMSLNLDYFSPSTMVYTNHGQLPGVRHRVTYNYDNPKDSLISVKEGLLRGGDNFIISMLSYIFSQLENPALIYREFDYLFPGNDCSLSARQDYPEALPNFYMAVSGYAHKVYPHQLAGVYHGIFMGGECQRPYIERKGEELIICEKAVADSVLSILLDSTFMSVPVAKRSSSVFVSTEEDETQIAQRCFVGSFMDNNGSPRTILCLTSYPERRGTFPRASPAEFLFKKIAESLLTKDS